MAITPHPALLEATEELCTRHQAQLLLRVRSGSHAYGLARADSDVDERGIFWLPSNQYADLTAAPMQISDAKSDHVYLSLRRVFELLSQSNPGTIELVHTPEDCFISMDPALAPLLENKAMFVSKALVRAKLGYAEGQIKKARGQNKWVNQAQPQAAPSAQDFCYWIPAQPAPEALPARPQSLTRLPVPLQECHVARVEHGGHLYRLYHIGAEARGVFRDGGLPVCESIPIAQERAGYLGLLLYNEQGYQKAKLDHQNYWQWHRERNHARWRAQEKGELDYDAKNMMHCMRLLMSAQQVLESGAPLVRVSASQREQLLAIRAGTHSYDQLLGQAQNLIAACEQALPSSELPDAVERLQLSALYRSINATMERR